MSSSAASPSHNPLAASQYAGSPSVSERTYPDTSRRVGQPRRPSSQPAPGLDPVPENPSPNLSQPSAGFLSNDPFPKTKGKEKESRYTPPLRTGSNEPVRAERDRVEWVVDHIEAQRGAEIWIEQERVILVVGSEFLSCYQAACCRRQSC